MKDDVARIIEKAIQLELNVAKLYMVFQKALPDDADFWWRLALEEQNHAALVRTLKENFVPKGIVPDELLSSSLHKIETINAQIVKQITEFKTTPPSREEAFNIAHQFEQSAGELHFQIFMGNVKEVLIDQIFQKLNGEDKDHAIRIRSYMEMYGISCKE